MTPSIAAFSARQSQGRKATIPANGLKPFRFLNIGSVAERRERDSRASSAFNAIAEGLSIGITRGYDRTRPAVSLAAGAGHRALAEATHLCYPVAMSNTVTSSTKPRRATYTFKVVVEPDDDVWQAYCPALKAYGAVTTREKALQHIREVVEMVVTELREDGEAHSRRVRFRGGHAGLRHRMSDVDWSRLRLQISRQRRA